MEIVFLPAAKEDLDFWVKTGNKPIIKKITQLISAIEKNPFEGIGKPEPLKQHRLVYEALKSKILVHSAKGHY